MTTPTLENTWQEIRDHLQAQKDQIVDEIQNYPPPIPACDAQFNYLIEQRGKISVELNRVDAAFRQAPSLQTLQEIIQTSAFLDETVLNQIDAVL